MNEKMSIGKGLLLVLVIIAIVAVLVVAMTVLGIPMWIPFLGLTAYTGMGLSFDYKTVVKFWVSAAAGLFVGYMLSNMATLGVIAIVIAVVGLFLMIFGMATQRMGYIFNSYMAIFLTVCTANGLVMEAIPAVKGIVFGFVVIGLLPAALISALTKKAAAKAAEAAPEKAE